VAIADLLISGSVVDATNPAVAGTGGTAP